MADYHYQPNCSSKPDGLGASCMEIHRRDDRGTEWTSCNRGSSRRLQNQLMRIHIVPGRLVRCVFGVVVFFCVGWGIQFSSTTRDVHASDDVGVSESPHATTTTLPLFELPWDRVITDVRWTSGPHSWRMGGQLSEIVPGAFANGLDFARPGGASWPVLAMAPGIVIRNDCGHLGLGCIVAIRHDEDGSVMIYGHLEPNSSGTAPHNDIVSGGFYGPGMVIGYAGRSGGQTNVHLHIELRDGAAACAPVEECGDVAFAGSPVSWDGLTLVDGYRIAPFCVVVNGDCSQVYNYDGSATLGSIAAPYPDFPFRDYDGTARRSLTYCLLYTSRCV